MRNRPTSSILSAEDVGSSLFQIIIMYFEKLDDISYKVFRSDSIIHVVFNLFKN